MSGQDYGLSEDRPRFRHDCTGCTFLGCYEAEDLYHCLHGPLPTVIRRYSSDGPDYVSGLAFADRDPVLGVALQRARDRGLNVSLDVH